MSVTEGVCYFWACGLQGLRKAQSFGNSAETDSSLCIWPSKLTRNIELQRSYLSSHRFIIHHSMLPATLANIFIITAQGEIKQKPTQAVPPRRWSYCIVVCDGGCSHGKMKNTIHKGLLGNLQPMVSPIFSPSRFGLNNEM